mgnify:CR=1 FL=1
MLLEALLPKELIHDLREEHTASLAACPRMNMGGEVGGCRGEAVRSVRSAGKGFVSATVMAR